MMQRFTRTKHVELNIYSECKYTASEEVFENQKVVEYEDVIGFEVVTGEQAKEIWLQGNRQKKSKHIQMEVV